MELSYRIIDSTEGFEEFRALLRASDLPADDLRLGKDLFIGYYEGTQLVGTGALEIYGEYGLLRSLSVKIGIRGKSVGSRITDYILDQAREKKLKGVYLLTETAHGFFLKKGFTDVSRENVPPGLKASSEFTTVCPASAVCMHLLLNGPSAV
jgi:amino-acid N-acetyltransferase